MEAANMLRVVIIVVLGLSTFKMSNCDEERHLCRQPVTVSFTEEVPKQLDEFGDFENYFQKLGIPGGNKTVTKTKLEDKLVCCPGYIKSVGGDCVHIQTTTEATTVATTEKTQTSTELTGTGSQMDPSSLQASQGSNQQLTGGYLSYILYSVLVIIIILTMIGAAVYYFQKRNQELSDNENHRVKYDAELQKALI